MKSSLLTGITLATLTLCQIGWAQESPKPTPKEPQSKIAPKKKGAPGLAFPRDKDRPVASIWGKNITLGEMVESLEKGYCPGVTKIFSGVTGTNTMDLNLPLLVPNEIDLRILRRAATQLNIKVTKAEIEKELRTQFDLYLKELIWKNPPQEKFIRARQASMLVKYRRIQGPRTEIDLLLNKLVPKSFQEKEFKLFFQDNGVRVNWQVKVAHIFVGRRDPVTNHLLDLPAIQSRKEKLLDIKSRLKADGSNFAEVARKYSELPTTARKGGELGMVKRWGETKLNQAKKRFHRSTKHPAISRAAFKLRQGEWIGPIEESAGFHFIKCLKRIRRSNAAFHWTQRKDELLLDMSLQKRENLLLKLRQQARAKVIL